MELRIFPIHVCSNILNTIRFHLFHSFWEGWWTESQSELIKVNFWASSEILGESNRDFALFWANLGYQSIAHSHQLMYLLILRLVF